ncbi:hypothetical protein [Streptomyces sp. FIT100]|uniref:hypothetical protein n=1 Tax=Streptomyces sp. FIT100 TaxID=2837956 RepID=UPI0021C9E7D1|nr:hypothetical protein [Streptomyces sp. FIT100]UUN27673.1 hypothetical protein KK483_15635 [Streptomyces sp. FIT100]
MNAEIITAAVLFTPAAVVGTVFLAGHRLSRRADDALAAALADHRATEPTGTQPPDGREAAPQPTAEPVPRLATVIDFPTRRRDAA